MCMDSLLQLFTSILPVSKEEEVIIKKHAYIEKISKKENFCDQGRVCKKLAFVKEGILKVVKVDKYGNEYIPYFITKGHFAVAVDSFTNQTLSEEKIEALTPCTMVTIEKKAYDLLEQQVNNFSKIISRIKERALVDKNNLKNEMFVLDAEARYRKLLEESPTVIREVSQKHISQFLGITQYTLSRIRAKI